MTDQTWDPCTCGEKQVTNVRELGECFGCAKRFSRETSGEDWSPCPECRGFRRTVGSTAVCADCGKRRQIRVPDRPAAPARGSGPTKTPTHLAGGGSAATNVLRAIGSFVVVGLGLAVAALIFLATTGFFTTDAESIEDLGAAFLGGITVFAILVFALLVGIVMAAFFGVQLGRTAAGRGAAVVQGALAGGIGHTALVLAAGLPIAFAVAVGASSDPEPAPEQSSAEEIAECEEIFGVGAEICAPVTAEEESTETADVNDVLRLVVGLVPAAFVGATTAALYSRPADRSSDESARW